jgi:[acyl-carrier-protein] S-malonyltransferase
MRKFACIFPGQGSQAVGMAEGLLDDPFSSYVFEDANEALGFDLRKLLVEGPEEELRLTENAQPAILTTSFAAWKHLVKALGFGVFPAFVAGHSLGEFSAITAAGGLDFMDAVRLVHIRGKLMQSAVPEGTGAMAAMVGARVENIEQMVERYSRGQVLEIANLNSEGQTVISGHAEAVERALDKAHKYGVKKAIKLRVSAPFHSSLMTPISGKFTEELTKTRFVDPMIRVIHNVSALPNRDVRAMTIMLSRQIDHPVRWLQTVQYMLDDGVDTFIEVGYGNVLQGLVKKIAGKDFKGEIIGFSNPGDVDKIASLFGGSSDQKMPLEPKPVNIPDLDKVDDSQDLNADV